MLTDALRELRDQRIRITPKPALSRMHQEVTAQLAVPQAPTRTTLQPQSSTPLDRRDSSRSELMQSTDDDEDEPISKRGKIALNETKQEVSVPAPDPKSKNGVVYWKFFNPGNRTFLELTDGKLQIIGSRRIQMLIESVPANSKFINAHLYVQKNDTFEAIEYCARCKENGIPNVFCVLPRRGREHDFPWITFRITCTSTAKHWKGSLFWIGAEFLLDPTQGTVMKVFSPPIHVQSKVKGKDLVASSSSIERVSSRESMRLDTPSPSPSATLLRTSSSNSIANSNFSPALTANSSSAAPSPAASPIAGQSSTSLAQPQAHAQIQLQALAAAAQLQSSSGPKSTPTTSSPTSSSVLPNSALSALLSSMMVNGISSPKNENGQLPTQPVKT